MALLASWPLTVYWVDAQGESGLMDISVTRAFAGISTWASSSFFFLIAADLRGVGRKEPERSHMSRVEAAYVLANASSCTAVSLCLLVRPEDASYGVYHQYFFFGNSLVIFLLLLLAAVGYVRSANYAIRQCLDLASPSLVSTVKKLRRLRLIVCFALSGFFMSVVGILVTILAEEVCWHWVEPIGGTSYISLEVAFNLPLILPTTVFLSRYVRRALGQASSRSIRPSVESTTHSVTHRDRSRASKK
eukprot:scaffold7357_cov195-Pinguiococcus_pyrenoidosus.AAC.3